MEVFLEKFRTVVKFSLAAKICLVLFSIFSLFHFAVIIGILFFDIVPLDFLWGGQMKTKEELFVFEIISFLVQVLCLWVLSVKVKLTHLNKSNLMADIVIWILCAIFFLNTIGNLVAKTWLETLLGTPITAILFVLLFRIGIEKKSNLSN